MSSSSSEAKVRDDSTSYDDQDELDIHLYPLQEPEENPFQRILCSDCDQYYDEDYIILQSLKSEYSKKILASIDETIFDNDGHPVFPNDCMSIIEGYIQPPGLCVYCYNYNEELEEEIRNPRCQDCGNLLKEGEKKYSECFDCTFRDPDDYDVYDPDDHNYDRYDFV